jgi:hypothetical protein
MFDGEKIDASRMLRGRDPKHREDFDGDIQETLGIIAVRLVSGDKGFFLSSAQFDFDRIQLYNSNISTFNGSTGGKNSNYYMFVSYSEKNSFLNGQFLHQQQYPNSNWNTIQEN